MKGAVMTEQRKIWALARAHLASALEEEGFPPELADLLAGQLKSPRAIDRMTAYLYRAHPASLEMVVDEMLAIRADADAWREKKESEAAQAGVSAWLNSEKRDRLLKEDGED